MFAALSDQPFDLGALRKTDADIKISVAGVKAMGYELGRVAFTIGYPPAIAATRRDLRPPPHTLQPSRLEGRLGGCDRCGHEEGQVPEGRVQSRVL